MRIWTFQSSRHLLDAIAQRQDSQMRLQAQVSSGLRVRSPGDDPLAAARVELARSRLSQLAQEQRATQAAVSAMDMAEQALGSGASLLQQARERLILAGNPILSADDRRSIALELRALRDQLSTLADTRDASGEPVFVGLHGAVYDVRRIGEAGHALAIDGRPVFIEVQEPGGPKSVYDILEDAALLVESAVTTSAAFADDLALVQEGVDRSLDAMIVARSRAGNEAQRAELVGSQVQDQTIATTGHLSDLRDVDVTAALIQLQVDDQSVQAALKAYAAMGKSNLFDLLR